MVELSLVLPTYIITVLYLRKLEKRVTNYNGNNAPINARTMGVLGQGETNPQRGSCLLSHPFYQALPSPQDLH